MTQVLAPVSAVIMTALGVATALGGIDEITSHRRPWRGVACLALATVITGGAIALATLPPA